MDASEIRNLRDRLRTFGRKCEAKQHTDTGEAWELLDDCEDMLGQLIGLQHNYEKMTQKAEHGCIDAYCRVCDG